MSASAYPLQWPVGWPRTPAAKRIKGPFTSKSANQDQIVCRVDIRLADALDRLDRELDKIGATSRVLSTNVEVRLSGVPKYDAPPPNDPGVCCYFELKGRHTSLPCDRYNLVAQNVAALAAHIEATRAIERYGVGSIEQMFTGFQAIRGPGPKPWREVLGIPVDRTPGPNEIRARGRELARNAHPDVPGGSHERMAEINDAVDRGVREQTP